MAKGGSFENEVACILSLWFTEGKRDDVFCRTGGSGARFTVRKKRGKGTENQAGDLTFSDLMGEPLIKIWNIECKTGYAGKKKIKDADGDIIEIPVYSKKKGEKDKIIKWKKKVELRPWDVLDIIDSKQKKPFLIQIWEQCKRDADLTNRQPILIFRRNSKTVCICIKEDYYHILCRYFGSFPSHILSIEMNDESILIVSLNSFFDWANPVIGFLSVS